MSKFMPEDFLTSPSVCPQHKIPLDPNGTLPSFPTSSRVLHSVIKD